MPTTSSRGRRSKRDSILAAASELLLAGGYENTSMDAVAATAGVSKTTVYAHFSDKLELFKAVMVASAGQLVSHLESALQQASGDQPQERLVTALTAMLRSTTLPELLAYFRVLITETERRRVLTEGMEEQLADTPDPSTLITPLLEDCAAADGFELVHAERFMGMLLHLVNSGIQLDMLISDYRPSATVLENHVRYTVGLFLRGIRPEKGKKAEIPAGYDYPWGPALFRES